MADQAANMKKAFENQIEADISDELVQITTKMLVEQKKIDFKEKQERAKKKLEFEIQEMNETDLNSNELISRKRKREEILEEFYNEDFEEEFTDNTADNDDANDTLADADDLETIFDDFIFDEGISKL